MHEEYWGSSVVSSANKRSRYDFCVRLSSASLKARAVLLFASWKYCIHFPGYKIYCGYDCRMVVRHVSKAHDILHVVYTTIASKL